MLGSVKLEQTLLTQRYRTRHEIIVGLALSPKSPTPRSGIFENPDISQAVVVLWPAMWAVECPCASHARVIAFHAKSSVGIFFSQKKKHAYMYLGYSKFLFPACEFARIHKIHLPLHSRNKEITPWSLPIAKRSRRTMRDSGDAILRYTRQIKLEKITLEKRNNRHWRFNQHSPSSSRSKIR